MTMKNVFRGDYFEAMNLKNLLERNDIQVFVENENMALIEPWVVASGGVNPVILKVNEADFELAQKKINDFETGKLTL